MDGLQLPIDSRTLESSISSRKLRAVDADGTLLYEESSDNRSTERLGRIWDEYPNGLLELTDAGVGEQDPAAQAVQEHEEHEEEEEEGADRSKPMPYHEMQRLREGLADQLNTARNELWFALELAKTLSVSTDHTTEPPPHPHQPNANRPLKKAVVAEKPPGPKGEPPVLPAGSYTATPATVPPKSKHTQIIDQELCLAAKHQALDECSALIDSAVEELQVMSEAGDRFWRDIRQLKDGKDGRGRWAIVPKPDFTRTMAKGETAKDVVIPYAVDEAPPAMRARCLAAFDLDPSKTDALTFGSRGYRRLRVSLYTDVQTVSSSLPKFNPSADIHDDMEAAQLEALDEDLYNEIQNELGRHPSGTVTSKSASLDMGHRSVVFEMCDTRSTLPNSEPSEICDTIALTTRLSLLHHHRRRKMRIIGNGGPSSPILLPIVQILQYQSAYQSVQSVLQMFVSVFAQAGLQATVDVLHPVVDDEESQMIPQILAGQLSVGGTSSLFKLRLEDCPGIAIDLTVPTTCLVSTSTAEFSLQDFGDLPSILADDLGSQLLMYAERSLGKAVDVDRRAEVFLDDLEGVVRLPLESELQITIRPPYSELTASIDGPIQDRYDAKGEQVFSDWLDAVASKVSAGTAM